MRLAIKRAAMIRRCFGAALFALLVLPAPASPAPAGVTATFRYPLSNFSGPVRSQWAKLAVDQERNEVYALNQRANDIRIFDEHGMQIFVFGDGFASAADIAIGNDGDIFVLSAGYQTATVNLLNYRGEQVSEIPLQNVPARFSAFVADRLIYSQGSLYLVDSDGLLVIVTDERGHFQKGYDLHAPLRPILDREERKKKEIQNVDWAEKALEYVELNGFCVDRHGNMLFTVPVLFSAFRLSPDGALEVFGRAGSGPGKFGVAAGITTDERGYIYVADRLRSVVLVFDSRLKFQTEFGYRGDRPSSLIVPDDVAVDRNGNLYVGQAANRGVSVFRVVYEAALHEGVLEKPVVDGGVLGHAVVGEPAAPEAPVRQARVRDAEVREPAVQEAEAREAGPPEEAVLPEEAVPPEEEVQETAIPSEESDTTQSGSERFGRAVEEDVPDEAESVVDLPDQMDFTVDQGAGAAPTNSEESVWTIEED
jgi:DNA-binding beta-propeller fold protein YncE